MESSIFRTSLESEHFRLTQMHSTDFDALYAVAKDPAIWAQHPESNRWQEAMFRRFFAAGLANPEGCFVITDKDTEQVIGSTRCYRFDHREPSVWLGYNLKKTDHSLALNAKAGPWRQYADTESLVPCLPF